MTDQRLTLERFRALLAAYGARLDRWPPAERDAARELVEASAVARESLREEERLDIRFDELRVEALSPGLERRLAEIPIHAARKRTRWPFASIWAPAAAWALAAVVGVLGGAYSVEVELGAAVESDEGELVALTTGAFAELEEEP